ncbi:hypothetical protein HNP37_001140 [Flavobacterium nitrogenifigens]|uniref:Lipoprotein n=2 Tax=Flavobacterium TaxID=237 RepID=A0A7W7IV19_9FLAO|nr:MULTISPECIES: hypothetical protein [Flavobacterium]MBB4801101.1 hypothetical protein [Flavobacterium nitrogenifigens]MBB6385151.1 hypothetical protein [Flavobacterium notoginsengisoli]
MKKYLLLISILIIGCSNPKTFILKDNKEDKYFVQKLIDNAFEKDLIGESPLIVINGIPFKYNKKQDTILIPLKKSDIITLNFLNLNSSRIIYNEKENDGAIIIAAKNRE